MHLRVYLFALLIFLGESACETCVHLLDPLTHNVSGDSVYPDRFVLYNTAKGTFENLEHLKPNLRSLCSIELSSDIEGETLHVGVVELFPYVLWTNKTAVTGYFGDVWMVLQDTLRFRSEFEPVRNYNDLRDDIGRFDILLTSSLVEISSTVFFSFSTVIRPSSYSLFALSEGTHISKWWWTRIFQVRVWLISIIFVAVLTFSMMSIYNVRKKICKQTENCHEFGYSLFNLLCVLGATSGQGFQELPRSWSLRFCALTTLCLGMLLSCGFNSTLTSYLTFRAPYVGINSLEDVWKRGTHSLCVRNKSLAHDKLSGNNFYDLRLVDKKHWINVLNRNCPDMYDSEEIKKNICKPGFVYMETSDLFLKQYRYIQHKCQIIKIPGAYWKSDMAFLISRGSKYRKIINQYLLRLRSTGIFNYLEKKWAFQQDFQSTLQNNYQEIELNHVQILITGLVICMFVSIIICIVENIFFKYSESSRKTNQFLMRRDKIGHLAIYNPFRAKPP